MAMSKQFGILVAFVLMVSMTANARSYRRHNQHNQHNNNNNYYYYNRLNNNQLKVKIQASMSKFLCDYTSTSTMCTWKSIVNNQVCDGSTQCMDGTDEVGCPSTPAPTTCPTCDMKCSDTEFTCKNKTCIPIEMICDGKNDCGDMSDETGSICDKCTCPDDQFQCTNKEKCILQSQICDGAMDCTDESDEPNNCGCIIDTTAEPTICTNGTISGDDFTIAEYPNESDPNVCLEACKINTDCKAIVLLKDDSCFLRNSTITVGTVEYQCIDNSFRYYNCPNA